MSSKIQNKLDQETLSPVVAIFLMFLLQMAGLLERDEEEKKTEENVTADLSWGSIPVHQSDSQLIPETQPFRLEHMPYPIPPAPLLAPSPLQYIQVSSPMVEATLVVPDDDITHLTVIPESLQVVWHHRDGKAKTQHMMECALEITVSSQPHDWCDSIPVHVSAFQTPRVFDENAANNYFIAGLCTPHRGRPLTMSITGEWIT